MKRIATLAAVLALAVVPAALADNGAPAPTPATQPPAAQQQSGQQQGARGGVRARFEILRLRLRLAELEFAVHCRGNAGSVPQKCVDFANKLVQRLQTLDGNVQKRIQALQACTASSTDAKCRNADKKIAFLQKVDTRIQALIARVQAWLNGSGSSSSSSDSSLDQAANGLGQLTQAVGSGG